MTIFTRLDNEFEAARFLGYGEGVGGFAPADWADAEHAAPRFSEPVEGWLAECLTTIDDLQPGKMAPEFGWSPPQLKVFTEGGIVALSPGDWISRPTVNSLSAFRADVFEANFKPKPQEG